MTTTLAPGPDSTAPLEVRLQYLRRRRRRDRWSVIAALAAVVAAAYMLLIGLGLFLH
jgi:hypothetical protein